VWQAFINVSQFFSYKESLFILATQGTNKWEHWTTTQKHPNLAAYGCKIREVKKVRKGDENCAETLKKQPNFYARKGNVRSVFFTYKPMILLVSKEWYGQPCDSTQARLDLVFGVKFLSSSLTLLSISPHPIVGSSWTLSEDSRGISLCCGSNSDE